jgi:hypothetical protein
MKQPDVSDFTVTLDDASVTVTFKPTRSRYTSYTYTRLADPKDIAKHGPFGSYVNVSHSLTGDTGEYPSDSVHAMAKQLAEKALGSK